MSFTAFFSGIAPHRAITPFFSRTPKRDFPRQLAHQNPNPCPTDKMDMYPTEIAQEGMSNIIKNVKAGRMSEQDANTQALIVILELKMALTPDLNN
jgi:hypothetical protein